MPAPCNNFTAGTNAVVELGLGEIVVSPCPTDIPTLAARIVAAMTAQLPGNFATFNIGSDLPAPENRDKLWYQVDTECNPIGWFIWTGAAWTSAIPHGTSPGTVDHYWSADLVGLTPAQAAAAISYRDTGEAYPGGGATALYSDPFWLMCNGLTVAGFVTPDLMGRVIVGCGNGTLLTARVPGDTGGEETHLLVTGEIPSHTHAAAYNAGYQALTAAGSFAGYGFVTTPTNASGATGGGLAHQNMPPYNCIYPVIRTARTI